jgi:hypothetical protein
LFYAEGNNEVSHGADAEYYHVGGGLAFETEKGETTRSA